MGTEQGELEQKQERRNGTKQGQLDGMRVHPGKCWDMRMMPDLETGQSISSLMGEAIGTIKEWKLTVVIYKHKSRKIKGRKEDRQESRKPGRRVHCFRQEVMRTSCFQPLYVFLFLRVAISLPDVYHFKDSQSTYTNFTAS